MPGADDTRARDLRMVCTCLQAMPTMFRLVFSDCIDTVKHFVKFKILSAELGTTENGLYRPV